MKISRKLIFFIIVVLIIVGGIFGFIITRKPILRKVTIRLDWLNQAQYAGMYVAIEKGFYRNSGLDVIIKEYQDGLNQTQEVADGKVDFAISTPVELLSVV